MVHPVVLGSGQRLVGPDEQAHEFRLVAGETPAGKVDLVSASGR